MDPMILSEFVTPIMLAKWDDWEVRKAAIRLAIEIKLATASGVSSLRGQEVVGVKNCLDSSTKFQSPMSIVRTKSETDDDLHLTDDVDLRALILWIVECANKFIFNIANIDSNFRPYVLNCWASSYGKGDYHNAHIHPGSLLSAVYCVSKPNLPSGEGALILHDPRPNIDYAIFELPLFSSSARIIDLAPGELAIFPGWLVHAVTPFQKDGQRISISLNLDAKLLR